MNAQTAIIGTHGLVIGSGMAGLLAARVLSDYFEQVTVVERDRAPEAPALRNGIPQAHHLHILLARGYRLLEQFFPGLDGELDAAGAPLIDIGKDGAALVRSGWAKNVESDLWTRSCSRALLEWCVRQRLAANPNVRFWEASEVTELLANMENGRVTGVRVTRRGSPENSETLQADLVVDASGRNSQAIAWLEQLGYGQTEELVVNSFLGYASRRYKLPAATRPTWKILIVQPTPPDLKRGAAIMQEEDGQWIVTLAGAGRDYPPTDEAGFMAFAQSLPTALVYDIIKVSEPLTPIHGYQRTANRWRRYDKLWRWPENFIVVGDAVAAFNPVYGQGMSAAALAAEILAKRLQSHHQRFPDGNLSGLAEQFQKQLAKTLKTPWLLATGEDLRYKETEGARPNWATRLAQRYVDQLLLTTPYSPQVGLAFLEVWHLISPPTTLARPDIIARVLWQMLNPKNAKPQERPPIV